MRLADKFRKSMKATVWAFWELTKITVPISVGTRLLQDFGLIEWLTPVFAPVMKLFGLPPELALTWLVCLMVGVWGAVVTIFSLVPVHMFTAADMTVLAALLLVAHGLPLEQRIIQKAGPSFWITTGLRFGGAVLFAALLHQVFAATGWLSTPLKPAWIPVAESSDWTAFIIDLAKSLAFMLVILVSLSLLMDLLKHIGILRYLNLALSPLFRMAGIDAAAVPFSAVGLFLGISYGAGMLLREAREATLQPRQIFLACVFMGFAHALIEDTLIFVSLGADVAVLLFVRLAFAVVATALIAQVLNIRTRWRMRADDPAT